MDDVPHFITASQVGKLLGYTRQHVSHLHRTGRLPEPLAVVNGHPAWKVEQFEDRHKKGSR